MFESVSLCLHVTVGNLRTVYFGLINQMLNMCVGVAMLGCMHMYSQGNRKL